VIINVCLFTAQKRAATARATSLTASHMEQDEELEDLDEEEEIDLISTAGSLEDLVQQARDERNITHRTTANPRQQPTGSDNRRTVGSTNNNGHQTSGSGN